MSKLIYRLKERSVRLEVSGSVSILLARLREK